MIAELTEFANCDKILHAGVRCSSWNVRNRLDRFPRQSPGGAAVVCQGAQAGLGDLPTDLVNA